MSKSGDPRNDDIHELDTNVKLLQQKVDSMDSAVKELITRQEFMPVKMIAYGLATAIMSSVIFAILAKVIIK
jgi:hypothetical protein